MCLGGGTECLPGVRFQEMEDKNVVVYEDVLALEQCRKEGALSSKHALSGRFYL